MKFDRALLSIKSSTRFKWAITFDARCLREKPPEKIDGYSREKERSLGIEKKNDNSIYDNNDDDTCKKNQSKYYYVFFNAE